MATPAPQRKSERTRQRILESALALFSVRGFAATTMRDISERAGVSPGLAYRYFVRKEDLAVALYEQLSEGLLARVLAMSGGSVAERFAASMLGTIDALDAHREAFLALAARAFDPTDALGVLGDRTDAIRQQARASYMHLAQGACDPPDDVPAMADLLYTLHLLLVLIWSQDRDPARSATREAISTAAGGLSMFGPLLATPHGVLILGQIQHLSARLGIAQSPAVAR